MKAHGLNAEFDKARAIKCISRAEFQRDNEHISIIQRQLQVLSYEKTVHLIKTRECPNICHVHAGTAEMLLH